MTYLGKFSLKEIEQMKRAAVNPFINEELGIKLTYVVPLRSMGEEDNLMQFMIFNYKNDENENEDKKGRSR